MGVAVSHCKEDETESPVVLASESQDAGDEETTPTKVAKEVEIEEDTQEEEASGDDGGEEAVEEEEEEEDAGPVVEVKSIPYDARFPTTNQARNCYTRYNEFYRCKGQKSEEDPECKFYQKAYRSICPGEWVDKWNEQREAGTWQGKY